MNIGWDHPIIIGWDISINIGWDHPINIGGGRSHQYWQTVLQAGMRPKRKITDSGGFLIIQEARGSLVYEITFGVSKIFATKIF